MAGYYNPGYTGFYPGAYAPMMQNQQPMAQASQTQTPQQGSLIFVQGEGGAKSYMVAPGCSVILMDSEASVFYIKSADSSGMPNLRIFDYSERKAMPTASHQDYVTRAEFDAFVAQMNAPKEKKKEAAENEKPDI